MVQYFNKYGIIISVVFLFFCLVHFFTQRPLWNDEQAVCDSIKTYSMSQVFSPLQRVQAYPRGQLFFIKLFYDYVSTSVLALRLWSLVAMVSVFLLWKRIYAEKFQYSWGALFSLALFAVSYRMSYYAAEFKPYSTDVLVVTLYLLFFQYQQTFKDKVPNQKLCLFSVLLPLLLFFSYAGIFVFWIVLWNYLIMMKGNKRLWKPLMANVVVNIICLGLWYWFDLRHSMLKGLYSYWQNYFIGYTSLESFIEPFGEGLREIITWWYGNNRVIRRIASPFIPLFLYAFCRYGIGRVKMVFKEGIFSLEMLFTVLFGELVVLSMLKQYPFTGDRVTLFFGPFIFYFIVKGMFDIKQKWLFNSCLVFFLGFLVLCLGNTFVAFYNMY